MGGTVKLQDLVDALLWVSASEYDNSAYVSRLSGKCFIASSRGEVEEALPEDIDDPALYLAVPHKKHLGLGRSLALQYSEQVLPQDLPMVQEIFRKRGAYGRFKDLLDRRGLLDVWHAYEDRAVEAALREWGEANGLTVV